jgi:succinoglycan biosynthesis transport protein ExoP
MLQIKNVSPPLNKESWQPDTSALSEAFNFLTSICRRQSPIFLVLIPCAMALGFVYLLTAPSIYTAVAKIVIDPRKEPTSQQQQTMIDMTIDPAAVPTQVEILTSDNINLSVINDLKLTEDPEFIGPDTGLVGTIFNLISHTFHLESARSELQLQQKALARFEARRTVRRIPQAYAIEISFQSIDAGKAARIANAISDAYVVDQLDAKYQSTRRASAWLQDRIMSLRAEASADVRALMKFRQQNNIVESGGKLMNEQQLSEVNTQLVLARAAAAEAKARLDSIQKIMSQDIPDVSVTDALKSEVIIKLRQQYLEIAGRESIWAKKYGPDHLATIALRNQMSELRRNVADEMAKIAQSYKTEYEIALSREASIERSLAVAVEVSHVTDNAQVKLRELESNAQTSRTMYDNFLQRYTETVQQQSVPMSEARLISRATPPAHRSQPSTWFVLAATTLGGTMAAFGVAALREASDRTFRTSAQIEDVLKVSCIAVLPFLKPTIPKPDDTQEHAAAFVERRHINPTVSLSRHVIDEPFSHFTESLRALKMIVDLNSIVETKKVIGVTSSLTHEGKSIIAANFGALVAHAGSRVILVDGDLRNPSLTRRLTPSAPAGLLDVAKRQIALDDAVWTDPESGLIFLPGSPRSAKLMHPNEILGSAAVRSLIDKLRGAFDYVIIDLPPLAPVVDTLATTGFIDSYVYVVEWGQTKVDVVKGSLFSAGEVYNRLLGVVLNKAEMSVFERYERHRSTYYNYPTQTDKISKDL